MLHPTETVVSLSGDPRRAAAVDAARRLKGYDEARPFLCLVPDAAAARALALAWLEAAERLAAAFWPGPLTLVVQASPDAPDPVVADGRIALRPAADPVTRRLLAAWGSPVFSTSANPRGAPPATRVEEAAAALPGGEVAVALLEDEDAPAPAELPSTVVDVSSPPRVVREGAIPLERLLEVVPDLLLE